MYTKASVSELFNIYAESKFKETFSVEEMYEMRKVFTIKDIEKEPNKIYKSLQFYCEAFIANKTTAEWFNIAKDNKARLKTLENLKESEPPMEFYDIVKPQYPMKGSCTRDLYHLWKFYDTKVKECVELTEKVKDLEESGGAKKVAQLEEQLRIETRRSNEHYYNSVKLESDLHSLKRDYKRAQERIEFLEKFINSNDLISRSFSIVESYGSSNVSSAFSDCTDGSAEMIAYNREQGLKSELEKNPDCLDIVNKFLGKNIKLSSPKQESISKLKSSDEFSSLTDQV